MIRPIHIFVTLFFVMFLFAIALQSNRNIFIYNRLLVLERENALMKQYLYNNE
jgi:hypothetical protein